MGMIPGRSEDLSRERDAGRNHNAGANQKIRKGTLKPLVFFPPNPEWHETCIMIWNSLESSGMWEFYQNTDLAMLWSLLEDLSTAKKSGRTQAVLLQTLYSQLNNFGFTEGDRRRFRIELEAPVEESSVADAAIAEYRQGLRLVSGN